MAVPVTAIFFLWIFISKFVDGRDFARRGMRSATKLAKEIGMLNRLFAAAFILGLLGVSFLPDVVLAESGETKVLSLGLTDHKVTEEELRKGDKLLAPHFNTPAVAYVLATNLKKGDVVEIALKLGDKPLLHNTQELAEDQASLLLQAGKTGVPAGGWPEGSYTASLEIKRDGKSLISQSSEKQAFD